MTLAKHFKKTPYIKMLIYGIIVEKEFKSPSSEISVYSIDENTHVYGLVVRLPIKRDTLTYVLDIVDYIVNKYGFEAEPMLYQC